MGKRAMSAVDVLQAGESQAALRRQGTASELFVHDDWLEAALENLALSGLARRDGVELVDELETLEVQARDTMRALPLVALDDSQLMAEFSGSLIRHRVIAEQFSGEFNEFDMRSPESMTPGNIRVSLLRAVRSLGAHGHDAAVRQIVFFIAGNLDEALSDDEDFE